MCTSWWRTSSSGSELMEIYPGRNTFWESTHSTVDAEHRIENGKEDAMSDALIQFYWPKTARSARSTHNHAWRKLKLIFENKLNEIKINLGERVCQRSTAQQMNHFSFADIHLQLGRRCRYVIYFALNRRVDGTVRPQSMRRRMLTIRVCQYI